MVLEEKRINELQKGVVNKIETFFFDKDFDISPEFKKFILLGLENLEIKLTYSSENLQCIFLLYFDQLEYSIFKNGEELSHCIVEDTDSFEKMTSRFMHWFQTDYEKVVR